jgi:hypothetical protein
LIHIWNQSQLLRFLTSTHITNLCY